LSDEEIADHASSSERTMTNDRRLVLACTFEGGTAEDVSGKGNDGEIVSAVSTKGKFGRAMQFTFRQAKAQGSFVKHLWTQDVPLMVRAMVKANDKLFIAGPPDLIDEEKTFQRTMARDPKLAAKLSQQDDALSGKSGGLMRVVSSIDGKTLAEYKLDTLPAWDGMAAAGGKIFMSTTDGRVVCYSAE
jgi:PQQ-like domain